MELYFRIVPIIASRCSSRYALQIDHTLTSGLSEAAFLASSHISQHGADVWITLDDARHEHRHEHENDLIVIKAIQQASLSAGDFHFV